MKKVLILFIPLFCSTFLFAQNECASVSPAAWIKNQATGTDGITHDIECVGKSNGQLSLPWANTVTISSQSGVIYADAFPGVDACAKINAAIGAVPSTGGTVDARGFSGTQACASNPFSGVTKHVRLLVGYATFNIGTVGWTLPTNSSIEGPAPDGNFTLAYTGTGEALTAYGSSDCALVNVKITTTADAATAFSIGESSQHCYLHRVFLVGNQSATNTGVGLYMGALTAGAFSGHLVVNQIYILGYKNGIYIEGAGGANQWTSATFINPFILGRSAGIIAGSVGIFIDANTNVTGGGVYGGTIEAFAIGYQVLVGGTGFIYLADNEANTTAFSFGGGIYQPPIMGNSANNGFLGRLPITDCATCSPSTAGILFRGSAGALTAGVAQILMDENNLGAGSMLIQAGLASAANGGALTFYQHAHATKPGWVEAGISSGSGGRFSVNTQALGGGTSVFAVSATGLPEGSGFKHGRITTGSCATTGCAVTLTWGTAFVDTNYTVSCGLEDATAQSETTGLRLGHITSKVAASVTMTLDNLSGAGVTGTLDCIAVHD